MTLSFHPCITFMSGKTKDLLFVPDEDAMFYVSENECLCNHKLH